MPGQCVLCCPAIDPVWWELNWLVHQFNLWSIHEWCGRITLYYNYENICVAYWSSSSSMAVYMYTWTFYVAVDVINTQMRLWDLIRCTCPCQMSWLEGRTLPSSSWLREETCWRVWSSLTLCHSCPRHQRDKELVREDTWRWKCHHLLVWVVSQFATCIHVFLPYTTL